MVLTVPYTTGRESQHVEHFPDLYEYRIVAEGLVDFSLHYKLMPWDHAAGVLIHGEAGGYSALLDGRPYLPTKFEGGIISAPNRECWQMLHDALLS